jgi:hypothetical protein
VGEDKQTDAEWPTVALVALFGAFGGVTAWVWSMTIGTPLNLSGAAAAAANIFLGGIAGFIGVFAIKLDSTRVLMHTLSIALLCGFAWKPVLEAGRELVITRIQDSQTEEKIESARLSIEALQGADEATAPIIIDDLAAVSQELLRSGDAIRSSALRFEANRIVSLSIAALNEAAAEAPEPVARGLGAIGAVALTEGQTRISQLTSDALVRMADSNNLIVATSAELSNSLIQMSGAASALGEPAQAQTLRALGLDVYQEAERRVEGNPQLESELRDRAMIRGGTELRR